MKKCSIIGLIFLLLAACENLEVEAPQQEAWNVTLSRSVTNGEYVWVVGKKDNVTQFCGILIPSTVEGETAQWQGNKPVWPINEELDLFVISPVPYDNEIPQKVNVNDNKTWMVEYLPSTYKPKQFTLTHLMGKLKVHIRISNDTDHQQPQQVQMTLHTEADIDYPNKALKNLSGKSNRNISLGNFSKETEDGQADNWVSQEILILPQTLKKGEKCLSFTDNNGNEYSFTPDKDLILLPGKVSHLYLGFAMNQLIFLGNEISITPWITEESNKGNAVEE